MMKEEAMSYTFDEQILSDLHKDAYGSRPSNGFWRQWNHYNDDEKQDAWDGILYDLEIEMKNKELEHMAAIQHLEANVQRNMAMGAPDRETAIRWVLQSLDLSEMDMQYGGSYVCYELGLPFDMAPVFDPILKEMR